MNRNQPNHAYQLIQDMRVGTSILDRYFANEYMSLFPNGLLTIREGYCSDGCSPVYRLPFSILGVRFIGPWNGFRNPVTGQPALAPAYNAHDVLLEHREQLELSADDIHGAFCEIIARPSIDFPRCLKRLYCCAVRRFGPTNR